MAAAEPTRWLVVDAQQTVEEMQAQIRSRVAELLGA
jgi:thymidylate kinase